MVPAVTETLFALGAGNRVVGVSVSCDFPTAAAALPKVGTFVEPVAEAIVALRPDLVLTSPTPGNQPAVRALERAGIQVTVVRSEGGTREVLSAIAAVAEAAGVPEAGRSLVASIEQELKETAAAAPGGVRPRVAVIVGREPLVLAGAESYLGELIEAAGGANIAAPLGGRWPTVGYEYLLEAAPEILIDLTLAMSADARSPGEAASASWGRFASIPAVAGGRIHPGRADEVGGPDSPAATLLRPGPRLGRASRVLAGWIHPRGSGAPDAARPDRAESSTIPAAATGEGTGE